MNKINIANESKEKQISHWAKNNINELEKFMVLFKNNKQVYDYLYDMKNNFNVLANYEKIFDLKDKL